jgi:hypothetical protein
VSCLTALACSVASLFRVRERCVGLAEVIAQIGHGEPLHPERERQLSAVMDVMLEDARDDPLARDGIALALVDVRIDVAEVGDGPAAEAIVYQAPAALQSGDERRRARRDCLFRLTSGDQTGQLSVALAHELMEPADAAFSDMEGDSAGQAQVRRGSPGELLWRERRDRLYKAGLIGAPSAVDSMKRRRVAGMNYSLLAAAGGSSSGAKSR